MKKKILIAGIIFITSAVILNAQVASKTIATRQADQQARIKEGVKTEELTRPEVRKLEREQKNIQIEKRIAKADGKVTPREKRIITKDQNRASRDIYRQKHDAQVR
jgi:hypothetical protein